MLSTTLTRDFDPMSFWHPRLFVEILRHTFDDISERSSRDTEQSCCHDDTAALSTNSFVGMNAYSR